MVEILARASVWLAMAAWTAGIIGRGKVSLWSWTAGLVFYLVHVVSAFHAFYGWSHDVAWEMTATQTSEVTGWESGMGIWFNYLFSVLLLIDVVFRRKGRHPRFSQVMVWVVLFMMLNGAVIFADGPVRWFGIFLLLIAVLSLFVVKWGNPVAEDNCTGKNAP